MNLHPFVGLSSPPPAVFPSTWSVPSLGSIEALAEWEVSGVDGGVCQPNGYTRGGWFPSYFCDIFHP